ncbi:MAG: hypothetical protein HYT65_03025 [Candidatus Yanofskybacteria bacterium]|nr:hypothetical protein [Candidatus Yanofskybacteria bacterium]
MKKALLIFVVVAGIIVSAAMFRNKTAVAPGTTESPAASASVSPSPTVSVIENAAPTISPTISAVPKNQTVTITFANGIATPNVVNIKAGDTVKFVNNDSTSHWPASGVHPTHQICPGFDALRGLNNGESYSFKFNEVKTCPWHDHLKPSVNGQIIINP